MMPAWDFAQWYVALWLAAYFVANLIRGGHRYGKSENAVELTGSVIGIIASAGGMFWALWCRGFFG